MLLINYYSFAQNTTENIEKKTLELFQNKQYKRLIYVGENAIKNNTDYFFLRFRIGVAYFELKNYRMATYHLEKALVFNSDDASELEYLYYAYILSGRNSEANLLASEFPDYLKEKINFKQKYINSIYFEGGPSISNNISKNASIDINDTANIYGENDLNDKMIYVHFGLKHDLLPRLSIYHGISNLAISKRKSFKYNDYSNAANIKGIEKDTNFNYTVHQLEYYINADIQLKNGIKLTPAFHFIHVENNSIEYSYDSITHIGTFITSSLNFNNYVASLSLSKEYKKATFSLSTAFSNLNSAKQFQGGVDITYFPFGNLDLYSSTNLTLFFQKQTGSNAKESRIIFDQLIGMKLLPKLWTEASLTLGNLANYNEKNAFIVYNIADKINLKTGISFIYAMSSKIELSLRYQLLKRENTYISYQTKDIINTNTTNYQNNTLIGGIKWKL